MKIQDYDFSIVFNKRSYVLGVVFLQMPFVVFLQMPFEHGFPYFSFTITSPSSLRGWREGGKSKVFSIRLYTIYFRLTLRGEIMRQNYLQQLKVTLHEI